MKKMLSQSARDVITSYEQLSLGGKTVSCPYFNNKRSQARAALAVTIGKGSPEQIQEEAQLLAKKKQVDLSALNSTDEVTRFLVDQKLGIDCSGFVYHVLDAELKEEAGTSITSVLSFPLAKNPVRRLLAKMRPAENTNVQSLAHEKNSHEVRLKDIAPGDMIVMFSESKTALVDHVLLVTEVTFKDEVPTLISYAHSYSWPSDGDLHHGIKRGEITITQPEGSLLDQEWEEAGKTGDENVTFVRMKKAKAVMLRRLVR